MFWRYELGEPLRDATRSMDVDHFTHVANHPSVRPMLGGNGPIALKHIIEDTRNFCFATPHGGFILWSLGSGRYDVHSLFLPDGRGPEAEHAMREVAAYMFARTDCTEGRTTMPRGNPGAYALARRAGFELSFEMARMPWREGETTEAHFLRLSLERWALTADAPLAAGRWFHDALEGAKHALGATREVHADDSIHDRMAGAAVMMIHGGQPEKAVAFYNAWAMTARYDTISFRNARGAKPIVLDIGDAVLEARSDGMEVLRCR